MALDELDEFAGKIRNDNRLSDIAKSYFLKRVDEIKDDLKDLLLVVSLTGVN